MERRIENFIIRHQLDFRRLIDVLINNENLFVEFIQELTVQVTEMFRDPHFFRVIRSQLLPILATYPRIKIWHAGCSSGEEVYSMAILLYEANLLDRSLIYATDINEKSLKIARDGYYPLKNFDANLQNYQRSGGQNNFKNYFSEFDHKMSMAPFLKKRIVFSFHNLVVDEIFAEVHMVFCRNVMIYFNYDLQQKVVSKLDLAIMNDGFLALGNKENIGYSNFTDNLFKFSKTEQIYRKSRRINGTALITKF